MDVGVFKPVTDEQLEIFGKTAGLECEDDLFFRGVYENHVVINLYHTRYLW